MSDSPDDWEIGCNCISCGFYHADNSCDNPGKWFLEIHLIDNCTLVDGGSTKAVVCQPCMQAIVSSCESILSWSLLGVRSPLCQGCKTPIVKLSHLILDIAKV